MKPKTEVEYIKPEIRETGDGSFTLYIPEIHETYHSHHGAFQESVHVFVEAGLRHLTSLGAKKISVFELGFGTGLNAFLASVFAQRNRVEIKFHSIEKFPVHPEVLGKLNYDALVEDDYLKKFFDAIIVAPWDKWSTISPLFSLSKEWGDFFEFQPDKNGYDLLFFDAFGFRAQSELWQKSIFEKSFDLLKPGGVLVTYAAKGVVRRTMEEVGFSVERLPGAPGKREMLRATKPNQQDG